MKICPSISRFLLVSLTSAAVCAVSGVAVADPTNALPASGPTASSMVPGLPFGASEVVKMQQGGIGKDIIVNYVQNAVVPFRLSADNIIYLQNLGVPQEITKAMIIRDGQLQQQAALYAQQMTGAPQYQAPPPQGLPPQGSVVMPSTPPPDVSTDVSTYPDYYDSGYPYYGAVYPYPYYGWWGPGYYGGWGFRGGFRGGFGPGFRGGFGGFHGGGAVRGGGFGGGGVAHGGGFGGGHGGGGRR